MRDGFPEIIDPIGFARNHDVVVNRAYFRAGVLIFDESECRHRISEIAIASCGHKLAGIGRTSQWRQAGHFQRILKRRATQTLQEYLTRNPSAAFAEDEIYWSSG